MLFRCNNGCTNVPQCYVVRTLPLSFLSYLQFYLKIYTLLFKEKYCCQSFGLKLCELLKYQISHACYMPRRSHSAQNLFSNALTLCPSLERQIEFCIHRQQQTALQTLSITTQTTNQSTKWN